jgi:hypothetical protein
MHLPYMHRTMSAQKPQEIQHAIGNDREPNRRPRRLANKLTAKTEDRSQTADCDDSVLFETAIYSRHASLLPMRPVY